MHIPQPYAYAMLKVTVTVLLASQGRRIHLAASMEGKVKKYK